VSEEQNPFQNNPQVLAFCMCSPWPMGAVHAMGSAGALSTLLCWHICQWVYG